MKMKKKKSRFTKQGNIMIVHTVIVFLFFQGTVELADQVEVLKYLSETLGYIDMNRVAIHGWSYGGYLSLMALAQHPSIFKVSSNSTSSR